MLRRARVGDCYTLVRRSWRSVKCPSDSRIHTSVQVAVFIDDEKYVLGDTSNVS